MKYCVVILLCTAVLCGFELPVDNKDRSFYEKKGEVVWEVPSSGKKIALTFDDGPYPGTTEKILDVLKKNEAKATFFVLGNRVERYPDIIKQEIAEGHEIANHTYNHIYFKNQVNWDVIQEEILKTEQAIEKLTGKKTVLFRPPGGYYNEQSIAVTKLLGYTTVLWSWHQDTNDWRRPGVQNIVNKVLKNARNGDIVLFHDHIPGSTQTVRALEILLPELKKKGYEMVTVSELLKSKEEKSIPIQW